MDRWQHCNIPSARVPSLSARRPSSQDGRIIVDLHVHSARTMRNIKLYIILSNAICMAYIRYAISFTLVLL